MIDNEKIKEILFRENYVTKEDIDKAVAYSEKNHASFLDYLFSEEIITKNLLGQAIAESFKLPYANFDANPPDQEQVLFIPEEVAKEHRVVFFAEDELTVTLATDNPEQADFFAELQKAYPSKKIVIAYVLPEDIDNIFINYRRSLQARFVEIIKTQKKIAPEILDEILSDTIAYRASDIHFEPQENEVIIRFRIDGVLHEAGRISKEYYENILNRIKVQANMRIDEHKSCQDGAIRLKKDNNLVDLRVSIAPTLDGEKVVIRLLAEYVHGFTVNNLGLSPANQKLLLSSVKKPFGMILVTGPTGSGKTTTLYALLKILNHANINITTIEDPVEYKIQGINQIQVNKETNITFTDGLRSIARQDSDIILVGEIRDKETAEIAVNAALTGHLLLSTFHANDAATAIPRLLEMGIEPFLVASSLEMIISQRLVRTICNSCRYSYSEKPNSIAMLIPDALNYFKEETVTLYKGKGCNNCNHTGFKGRIAIFEFIQVTPLLQDLILIRPAMKQIWNVAKAQGSVPIFEDGLQKVLNGVTTLEELIRVAPPPVA